MDSADIYGDCEELIGKWLAANPEKRSSIILATKFGFEDPANPMKVRSDGEYCRQAIERSLQKLNTSYIDLYYVHRVDAVTPIEKTIEAMAQLKAEGKIKYLGLSEVSARTLRRAAAVHPIAALQTEFSPFSLEVEEPGIGVLAACKELGTALVAYSPLGRGFLTGALKSPEDVKGDWREYLPRFSEENFPKSLAVVEKIEAVAEKKGVSVGQVTLAWLLAQGEFVIPIPGTRRVEKLEENLGAAEVVLSQEEIGEIRKACDGIKGVDIGGRYPEVMMNQLFANTPEL